MSRSIQEKVAGLYYTHGLFCSSHPYLAILIGFFIVFLCCFSLVNLPVPGVLPKIISFNTTDDMKITEKPILYVQQVFLRAAVIPWAEDLTFSDGFRGPLYEVFNLLEIIQNYQNSESKNSLSQVCLHVEAVLEKGTKKSSILPEYNCLILSPANFWHQSVEAFMDDTNIIETIFSHQDFQKGKVSTLEMLFGMNSKETGINPSTLKTRQRIIQYAITLFCKKYDLQFLRGLKYHLTAVYPLHQFSDKYDLNSSLKNETIYIFYPDEFIFVDFFPLTVIYVILFFYVYYSVRKIELIQSKIVIALSATITVISSLLTSVGTCFFFGLTLKLSGKEIFPYLIIIVGLENVLVLTKSVVSTPVHLDMKIRVAQGLSREGWSITKNLLIEVTILTMGLFTFVPAIQEFCIFAIVGLLSDFFLQMVFFSTTLAIDIRKTEMLIQSGKLRLPSVSYYEDQYGTLAGSRKKSNICRSKSQPKLNVLDSDNHTLNLLDRNNKNVTNLVKVPKRLKIVHFWASTRIFQRAFMIWMVVWISIILYNSEIVKHIIYSRIPPKSNVAIQKNSSEKSFTPKKNTRMKKMIVHTPFKKTSAQKNLQELNKLRPRHISLWNGLSPYHWSSILQYYNISMVGKGILILPAIKLSHAVSPEFARQISNPNDAQRLRWRSLASVAFNPLDFSDIEITPKTKSENFDTNTPFVPSSPMEIFLAAILCLISFVVVLYTMVVLYRCICSRNYPEWRASWTFSTENSVCDTTMQYLTEKIPLVLEGHSQEIEFIVTDGNTLASSCLAGVIKVWEISSDSKEERAAMLKALRQSESLFSRYYLNEEFNEVTFHFELRNDIIIGQSFSVVLAIKNRSFSETYQVSVLLRVETVTYTGKIGKPIKKSNNARFIRPGVYDEVHLEVTWEEYGPKLLDQSAFNISCLAAVNDTNYEYYAQDDFRVRKPDIKIQLENLPVVGEKLEAVAKFTNPLPIPLKRGKFLVEGPGLDEQLKLKLLESVDSGGEAICKFSMKPLFSGWSTIAAKFYSKELNDVDGFISFMVGFRPSVDKNE